MKRFKLTDVLIVDLEIKKCIPQRNKPNNPDYEYCAGWNDFQNMGISAIGIATQSKRIAQAFDFEQHSVNSSCGIPHPPMRWGWIATAR